MVLRRMLAIISRKRLYPSSLYSTKGSLCAYPLSPTACQQCRACLKGLFAGRYISQMHTPVQHNLATSSMCMVMHLNMFHLRHNLSQCSKMTLFTKKMVMLRLFCVVKTQFLEEQALQEFVETSCNHLLNKLDGLKMFLP